METMETVAYLLHISHYDPCWCVKKDKEEVFDPVLAEEVIKKLAVYGYNTLIIDCADGLEFKSHPELKRHYTISQKEIHNLIKLAGQLNIDIIPKLNFSKSGRNMHDMWMAPHSELVSWTKSVNSGVYWEIAEDVIRELIALFKPGKYFHIGMDEDHYRSIGQYADTINRLDSLISRHGLGTVVWNDSCYWQADSANKHHEEKCLNAEPNISRNVTHTLWEYETPCLKAVRRLVKRGFDVWAAPGKTEERVLAWKKVLMEEGGKGIVMTNWIKCSADNRENILSLIDKLGPFYDI